MSQDWYYTANGGQHGPISAGELKKLALSGTVLPEDLVWKEGMPNWVPAKSVKGMFTPPTGASGESTSVPTSTRSGEFKKPKPVEILKPVEPETAPVEPVPEKKKPDSRLSERLGQLKGKSIKTDSSPEALDEVIFADDPEDKSKRKPSRNEDDEDRSGRNARRNAEDEEEDRPRRNTRHDDDDDEERPSRQSRRVDDDGDDDRSRRSSRRNRDDDDDEEDERSRHSSRRRLDDDDDDDDRSRRSSRRRYDDDDDDDYRERRPKRRKGQKPGNAFGIISMISGILSLVLMFSSCIIAGLLGPFAIVPTLIFGFVAIGFGFPALKTDGRGMGIAGLITGFTSTVATLLIVVMVLVFGFALLGAGAFG